MFIAVFLLLFFCPNVAFVIEHSSCILSCTLKKNIHSIKGGIKIPQFRLEFGKLAVIIPASCVKSVTDCLNCPSGMRVPPEREEMRNGATFPATSETANI